MNGCADAQSCRLANAAFIATAPVGHAGLVERVAFGKSVSRANNTNGAEASILIATVCRARRTVGVQEQADRSRM
jgi:hypothetical protein